MPSLYAHEELSHSYSEKSDAELQAYALELQNMRQETEIPRQHQAIIKLLGRIAFESHWRIANGSNM